MPRILMIQYSMVTGGAGMQIARLAERLASGGWEVDIFAQLGNGGASADRLGKARLIRGSLSDLMGIAAERPYDVVDAAWPLLASHQDAIQGVLAACRWRARLSIHCHSEACFLLHYDTPRTRLILRAADAVIFHHAWQRADMLNLFSPDLQPVQCVEIPPGIDVRRFRPGGSDLRAAIRYAGQFGLARPAMPTVVAMAGRPSAEKNWIDYAIVARRLKDELGDKVRCLAVTGPQRGVNMRRDLIDLARMNAALGSPLTITGLLDDWENLLASVDVYVQMSCSESFCRTAAEACACGVPVVASSVGGLAAVVVKHGKTGMLVPLEHGHRWKFGLTSRDRAGFYKGILKTIGELARVNSGLTSACRRHAEDHLDDRPENDRHAEVYEQLLKKPARPYGAVSRLPAKAVSAGSV